MQKRVQNKNGRLNQQKECKEKKKYMNDAMLMVYTFNL